MKYQSLILSILLSAVLNGFCQIKSSNSERGSLFIIGGGDRSVKLMQSLVNTAKLQPKDYIVILPMSGANPDTSFFYIKEDLQKVCSNAIVMFNFTKASINKQQWIDSMQKAQLIFITGGDQSRFMNIVLHTAIQDAIKNAFAKGATIAGTSAGAAMMSEQMITGNELRGDSIGSGPFTKIKYSMVELTEGLGLLNTAIIDQHFIIRSRYNRLLSVLAANPTLQCIGIDEATAIIVQGKKVTVTGESQVIRMRLPGKKKPTAVNNEMVRLQQVQLDVLTAGDFFMLD